MPSVPLSNPSAMGCTHGPAVGVGVSVAVRVYVGVRVRVGVGVPVGVSVPVSVLVGRRVGVLVCEGWVGVGVQQAVCAKTTNTSSTHHPCAPTTSSVPNLKRNSTLCPR